MRTIPSSLLAYAVSAVTVSLYASGALAQYQTQNNSGRALDANNRLGSGGANDERRLPNGVTANDIVYGNVTRGQEFRGNASPDPREFRGNLNRPSDNLVRDFGPSVYEQGAAFQYESQRYYGDNRGVRPPEGFAQVQVGSPGSFVVNQPIARVTGDQRMDASIPNPDLSLPRAGELMGPGPIYALGPEVAYPTLLGTGNPLPPSLDAQRSRENIDMPSRDLMRRLQLDESQFRQMREELLKSATEEQPQQNPSELNPDDLSRTPENPGNEALSARVDSSLQASALSNSLNTNQSLRQNLLGVPAAIRQSTQYAELQRRLDRFRQRIAMTDQQANQQFMAEWNAQQEAKRKADAQKQQQELLQQQQQANLQKQTPTEKPGAKPADTAAPVPPPNLSGRIAKRQAEDSSHDSAPGILPQMDMPLRIASFADGVKATGLKRLLSDAERSMQAGKFTQALDYYDAAASVAPNNPMVLMGRSVAELGAGYYARAQIHLEQVLSADPALMMARYDLKTFYGEDRLQYIVRDLKDIAQTEKQQARPLFLLAFIAFSTENKERTADYLNLAEQRGGSKLFYDALREHWRLNVPPNK